MKIKYDDVVKKNPSEEFKVWWLENFCKREVYYEDFLNAKPSYRNKQWFAQQYFCEELKEFEGIKVGDWIYHENCGIGSIGKNKISKIQRTMKGVVFFWVGQEEKHWEWNKERLFKTLDGLKEYWIRKIIHLEE